MKENEIDDLESIMDKQDGNFQIQYDSIKVEESTREILSFSVLCVASHKSKYMDDELKERNDTALKIFPKDYSFNKITEFDSVENLGDGDSFYEFKLTLRR